MRGRVTAIGRCCRAHRSPPATRGCGRKPPRPDAVTGVICTPVTATVTDSFFFGPVVPQAARVAFLGNGRGHLRCRRRRGGSLLRVRARSRWQERSATCCRTSPSRTPCFDVARASKAGAHSPPPPPRFARSCLRRLRCWPGARHDSRWSFVVTAEKPRTKHRRTPAAALRSGDDIFVVPAPRSSARVKATLHFPVFRHRHALHLSWEGAADPAGCRTFCFALLLRQVSDRGSDLSKKIGRRGKAKADHRDGDDDFFRSASERPSVTPSP